MRICDLQKEIKYRANCKRARCSHIDRLRNLRRDAEDGKAEANWECALQSKQEKRHRKQTQEKRHRKQTRCTLCSYLFEYANHSQIVKFTRGVGQHGARAIQQRGTRRTRRVCARLNLLPYN